MYIMMNDIALFSFKTHTHICNMISCFFMRKLIMSYPRWQKVIISYLYESYDIMISYKVRYFNRFDMYV
jgi:hypothetical protein